MPTVARCGGAAEARKRKKPGRRACSAANRASEWNSDCARCACQPSRTVGPPAADLRRERVGEEQDQRHEQRVDHQRLDQHQAEDHRAADVAGRARVAGDAFHRRADRLALAERAERGGNGQREAGGA